MSAAELEFWRDVYSEEFMGSEREDYRAARVEATVENMAGKHLVEGVQITPLDRMPFRWTGNDPEKEPVEEATEAFKLEMAFLARAGREQAKAYAEQVARDQQEERERLLEG